MRRVILSGLFTLILLIGSVINVVAAYCPHADTGPQPISIINHHAHMDHKAMSSDNATALPEVCDLGMTCTYVMSSILQQPTHNTKVSQTSGLVAGEPIIPLSTLEEHIPPPPRV